MLGPDTYIRGVFRCCISSLANQIQDDKDYQPGDTLICEHCKRKFTLQPDPAETDKLVWQSQIG